MERMRFRTEDARMGDNKRRGLYCGRRPGPRAIAKVLAAVSRTELIPFYGELRVKEFFEARVHGGSGENLAGFGEQHLLVGVVEEEHGVLRALRENEGVLPGTFGLGGRCGPIIVVVVYEPAADGAIVFDAADVFLLGHVERPALKAEDLRRYGIGVGVLFRSHP